MIYILHSSSQPKEVRNLAGIVLKSQMEVNTRIFTNDTIEYFKPMLVSCFFDRDYQIKKTVSNLINTFIRHFGMDAWPEVLDLIEDNLDKKEGNDMAVETLNIILEDFQGEMDDKFSLNIRKIIEKLIFCVKSSKVENNLAIIFLNTLNLFLDSCQEVTYEKLGEIVLILKEFSRNQDNEVKNKVAKCWYSVIHLEKRYVNEYYDELFNFFLGNFNSENPIQPSTYLQ